METRPPIDELKLPPMQVNVYTSVDILAGSDSAPRYEETHVLHDWLRQVQFPPWTGLLLLRGKTYNGSCLAQGSRQRCTVTKKPGYVEKLVDAPVNVGGLLIVLQVLRT